MPSIDWNRQEWQERYDWEDAGEEWSGAWGNSGSEWNTCIYPRIKSFLPANSVLEIGPGFGRWTEYLLPYCGTYVGVDLAERCIAACQKRFEHYGNVNFIANDGVSLKNLPDRSVDFIFSFDSLVHAEYDVIGAYLHEFRRVLTSDGVAFVHHSNLGACQAALNLRSCVVMAGRHLTVPSQRFPGLWAAAGRSRIANLRHARAASMTSERFCELSDQAGLACIGQEVINWIMPYLIDCISIVTSPGSKWERENIRVKNRKFAAAARSAAAIAQLYDF